MDSLWNKALHITAGLSLLLIVLVLFLAWWLSINFVFALIPVLLICIVLVFVIHHGLLFKKHLK